MIDRLRLNSNNSSKPPSSDPNRQKKAKQKKGKHQPGGQPGRIGKQLKQVEEPDIIETLAIEKRQVFDLEVNVVVTECQAQVLTDEQGNRYVAQFPTGVTRPVQYGNTIKARAVYTHRD